jgi:hypothetical protein
MVSHELDGISNFVNIYNQDPRNQYDDKGLMKYEPIPQFPGYYMAGPSVMTDNYHKYPNIAFKYVIKMEILYDRGKPPNVAVERKTEK